MGMQPLALVFEHNTHSNMNMTVHRFVDSIVPVEFVGSTTQYTTYLLVSVFVVIIDDNFYVFENLSC